MTTYLIRSYSGGGHTNWLYATMSMDLKTNIKVIMLNRKNRVDNCKLYNVYICFVVGLPSYDYFVIILLLVLVNFLYWLFLMLLSCPGFDWDRKHPNGIKWIFQIESKYSRWNPNISNGKHPNGINKHFKKKNLKQILDFACLVIRLNKDNKMDQEILDIQMLVKKEQVCGLRKKYWKSWKKLSIRVGFVNLCKWKSEFDIYP